MANKFDLSGRFGVVTGGAQGIGRAIAERFVASGAKVALWDKDIKLARETAKAIGPAALALEVDITDPKAVAAAKKATLDAFKRIDILVNNAGIVGPTAKLWEIELADLQRTMRLNFEATYICCQAIVPLMVGQNYGRIVNIASIAGKEGNANASPYSASKAAVIAMTKSLGKELAGHDIMVNAIAPAAAKTAIFDQMPQTQIDLMLSKIPKGRFVRVDEIAALATWAASEDCSFTTAQVFDITGGRATY